MRRFSATTNATRRRAFIPRLLKTWDRIRSSLWFIPSLMTGGAALAAFGAVTFDRTKREGQSDSAGLFYSGGAEGASELLATIVGSMVTITGVVFSMTLVALSLASRQLGPRLLRNFMRDPVNQVVLGTFVATFLYCLLVLRTIRRPDEGTFVPESAVSLGVLFAVVSVGVLIYFIHHISLSVQADHVVARVEHELSTRIDEAYPDELDPDAAEEEEAGPAGAPLPETFDAGAHDVPARKSGYVQTVDIKGLRKLASEYDVVVRVEVRPGGYVIADMPLARVWPSLRVTDDLAEHVGGALIVGTARTPVQDVEFAVDQLVEIAVRALSTGVNDPYTAIRCVDRLGSALARIARRRIPSTHIYDEHDRLRVVRPVISFPDFADAALNQIRQNAVSTVAVTLRLLETIAKVAELVIRDEDREALRRHAEMLARVGAEHVPEEEDRKAVDARYRAAMRALGGAASG